MWRRPGEDSATGQTLLVPHLKGSEVDVRVLFPHDTKAVTDWSPATGELTVQLPVAGTACLIAMG